MPEILVSNEEVAPSNCLNSHVLSDFSSAAHMQQAGWFFEWNDDTMFKPSISFENDYQITDYIPRDSYWGFSKDDDGAISLVVKGRGSVTVDFGNPSGDDHGTVTVLLNGAIKSVAEVFTFSKTVELSFHDGDWLEIREEGGVIVINSIIFKCGPPPAVERDRKRRANRSRSVADADDAIGGEEEDIDEVQKRWQHAYTKHQSDSLRVKRKEQVYAKASELRNATLERITNQSEGEESPEGAAKGAGERAGKAEHAMRTETEPAAPSKRGGTPAKKLVKAALEQERRSKEALQAAKQDAARSEEEEMEMAIRVKKGLEREAAKKEGGLTEVGKTPRRHGLRQRDPNSPSLFCYSLTMPFGYEPNLLRVQQEKGVGIFACDLHTVFSNSTTMLDKDGGPLPIAVSLLNISLAVPFGGKWHTALNTQVFNNIWTEVVRLGVYKHCDWTVKADPDSVFFPNRLVVLLQDLALTHVGAGHARALAAPELKCGNCQREGYTRYTCGDSVRWLQKQGKSCPEALRLVHRPPPVDCGCACNQIEACDVRNNSDMYEDGRVIKGNNDPENVYINNCKFGLHGPIEVLSRKAVTTYVRGLPQCRGLEIHAWGEDKFMDRCMLELGVMRVNRFGMLNEIACDETPAPCGGGDVAFHPFKTIESYFACWGFATKFGGIHGEDD